MEEKAIQTTASDASQSGVGDTRYQVFLSHASRDKPFVRQVAERLQRDGVSFFLDEAHLVPGTYWQPALENAVRQSASCAVFIGNEGLGPYHSVEMRAAISEQLESNRGFRVIPVLLPGLSRPMERDLPLFLKQLTWVAFNNEPDADETAYKRLKAGINGTEPGFNASTCSSTLPSDLPEAIKEDLQKKSLVAAAIHRLSKSKSAIKSLAKTLTVQVTDDSEESARLVIDQLLETSSLVVMLNTMICEMNRLDRQQEMATADCIEQVAYLLIPASLTNSQVEQISLVMKLGDNQVAFNAKTKAMVETAIARINGREIKFRPIASATDNARGVFCLEDPPEQGMDGDGEKFIDDFVGSLSTMVGEDLLGGTRAEKVQAINSRLEFDFVTEHWQYYYVFGYPKREEERKVRFALAQRLDKMFPKLAVVGLDRSTSNADELDLVTRMMRILCRASGIEYKPHGKN